VALAAAGVGFAVTAAYFHGLQKAAHHPPPPGAAAVGVTAVNFLGLAAGPVTAAMHPFGYDGPAVLGVVVTALVAATLGLLAVRLGRPEERTRAVLAGGLLVGWLGLAGGLAYGRAGLGNVLLVSRYVTLAMPVLVLAYFVWTALGGRVGGRVVPAGLALLAVLTAVPNHRRASADAGIHASRVRKVEREIRAGVPIGFVADGNRYVLPLEPWHFRQSMEFLRDHGVRPFADLRPDSPLSATDLPFAVTTEGPVTEQGGSFAVGRGIGTVVLRLPRPVRAYALALTYEAVSPGPHLPAMVSWDAGGRAPPAPGKGVLDQLMPTAGPLTTRVLVDAEVDALRLDICGPGTRITLHKLAVLGRTD
ncbi:MAG: hypothetical protein K2X82_10910, partial [Gemmataceae bacterium]|nr:hypothetical protein [Gemmataceae bacterium]